MDRPPTFHALLVGADGYFPNALPNGAGYLSLSGCVNDIRLVQAMLKERLVDRQPSLTILTSVAGDDGQPAGDPATWPTADNLRRALADIAQRAEPGDQVYVHYSGHGGRVTTQWPELKGSLGVDEALVPIDIGATDAEGRLHTRPERYLRDVELASYLDQLARKVDAHARRIHTTLVFDTCHSGGATRGASTSDLAVRCATQRPGGPRVARGSVDRSAIDRPAPPPTTDAQHAMADAFRRLRDTSPHAGVPGTSWLPPARGYVLLASCRDVEAALEGSFDGRPAGGVLTSALFEALSALGTRHTWQTIYDRVLASVQRRVTSQTPQLLGDVDRQVFGAELRPADPAFVVTAVEPAQRHVTINAGHAVAVTQGTELDIFRPGTTDFSSERDLVAIATVYRADAAHAYAEVDDPHAIEVGAPAVLRSLPLRRTVELVMRNDLPEPIAQRQRTAMAELAQSIQQRARGFVEVCPPGQVPHYQVALTTQGQYEIADPQGIALPHLAPISGRGAAAAVADRLCRLSHYHTVLALTEPSPLVDQLQLELFAAPPGWDDTQPFRLADARQLDRTGDAYTVRNGDWIWLAITNQVPTQPLNIALLCLGQTWEVELVIPDANDLRGAKYVTVGDRPLLFDLRMTAPLSDTVDTFKLFIARDDVDFRMLAATPHRTRDFRRRSRITGWGVHDFRVRTLAPRS